MVDRDNSYKMRAIMHGESNSLDVDNLVGEGVAGTIVKTFQIDGGLNFGTRQARLSDCVYRDIKRNWLGPDGQSAYQVNILLGKVASGNFEAKDSGHHVCEWFINGPREGMVYSRTTRRTMSQVFERERHSIDSTPVNTRGDRVECNGRDFFYVNSGDIAFLVCQVPDVFAPSWSKKVSIEYRREFGNIPDNHQREVISELVSFFLGRQLLRIGQTTFDKRLTPIYEEAISPWGSNVVDVCSKPDVPPISYSDKELGRIEDVLNRCLPAYLKIREELRLNDVLWRYWIARSMPLGTNIPILASALEVLRNAWFRSYKTKSGGVYMAKKEYSKLISKDISEIEKKLGDRQYARRMVTRIELAYNMGNNERTEIFFEEAGIKIGREEIKALKIRNKMIHGDSVDDDDKIKEIIHLWRVYECLFHRTLLKILGYQGNYIDRGTIGLPERGIEEPSGG